MRALQLPCLRFGLLGKSLDFALQQLLEVSKRLKLQRQPLLARVQESRFAVKQGLSLRLVLKLLRHFDRVLARGLGAQPRLLHQQACTVGHVDDSVTLGIDEVARKPLPGIRTAQTAGKAHGLYDREIGRKRVFAGLFDVA